MRVISGKLKGRVLKGYQIEGTRPTMDRVKESVFASIQNYIQDAVILDLFAGTGNLGIEAISNGANKVYFVDNNHECIKTIRENIRMFQIEKESILIENNYKKALKYFCDCNIQFDIIFIDPPYKYQIKKELLDSIADNNLLKNNGIIIYEYQINEEVENSSFKLLKTKRYGDKYVSIYQKLN